MLFGGAAYRQHFDEAALREVVADFPHRAPGEAAAGQGPFVQDGAVVAVEAAVRLDAAQLAGDDEAPAA